MSHPSAGEPTLRKALRLWPGVALVALQWLIRYGVPAVWPEALYTAIMGALGCGLAVVVWWVIFSRARWWERVGAVVLMAAALAGVRPMLDASVATGMMGMLFFVYGIPTLCLAFVVWAVLTRRVSGAALRGATLAAAIVGAGEDQRRDGRRLIDLCLALVQVERGTAVGAEHGTTAGAGGGEARSG
jgi:hypothetical protein